MMKSCTIKPNKTGDCDCNARQGLMIMLGFLAFGLVGMWVAAYLS